MCAGSSGGSASNIARSSKRTEEHLLAASCLAASPLVAASLALLSLATPSLAELSGEEGGGDTGVRAGTWGGRLSSVDGLGAQSSKCCPSRITTSHRCSHLLASEQPRWCASEHAGVQQQWRGGTCISAGLGVPSCSSWRGEQDWQHQHEHLVDCGDETGMRVSVLKQAPTRGWVNTSLACPRPHAAPFQGRNAEEWGTGREGGGSTLGVLRGARRGRGGCGMGVSLSQRSLALPCCFLASAIIALLPFHLIPCTPSHPIPCAIPFPIAATACTPPPSLTPFPSFASLKPACEQQCMRVFGWGVAGWAGRQWGWGRAHVAPPPSTNSPTHPARLTCTGIPQPAPSTCATNATHALPVCLPCA
ncbi:unnamed protein product [Closterium sp. Naga37s-1]|nr:unnamed protein product [Closterium sp. Naga37s-1]